MKTYPGADAVLSKGWLRAHQWLLLRRISQLGILLLFLLGPWYGVWIVKGNLSASLTLDVLPLTDPFVLLQTLAAGHWPLNEALIGAAIVLVFYILVGGRSFCAWVCPVNMVTDTAGWLRVRFGIKGSLHLSRVLRYWLLAFTLLISVAFGAAIWEFVNPVSMTHRALIFGGLGAFGVTLAVFLFDLLLSARGWCGHLCPMGAFYSIVGRYSPLRVRADQRAACNDCMDCFAVCPEPQVIKPALKGEAQGIGPVILSPNCTHCGRCIDVCSKLVFNFGSRYGNVAHPPINNPTEVLS